MATAKQEICDVTMFPSTNFKLFKKYVPVGSKCNKYSGAGHLIREVLVTNRDIFVAIRDVFVTYL